MCYSAESEIRTVKVKTLRVISHGPLRNVLDLISKTTTIQINVGGPMLYVKLLVFVSLVVVFVATVIHESILRKSSGSERVESAGPDLASFSLCCVISALGICVTGWLLRL